MGKHYKPGKYSDADCDGWSKEYRPIRPQMRALCADPVKWDKQHHLVHMTDNGHYLGHDEPSVRFLSDAPNSANTFTTYVKLPVDPKRAPTPSGSVTNYADLSVAPWVGVPLCDPGSYPQNPCRPDSDSNQSEFGGPNPNAAGSALMEMQFYAPGYTPFVTGASCGVSQWCAAMTIDSLEETAQGVLNGNCVEPVNFAFIQSDGVPAGPPSPVRTSVTTFIPNSKTLMMNQGDTIKVSVSDPAAGFTVKLDDLTTGRSGFMVASAANGFINTSVADCSSTPFTFHAEYSTASPRNVVPWTALDAGILIQNEIGHSESCNSLSNQDPEVNGPGQTATDNQIFDTCNGGDEGPGAKGEGPCDANGSCQNATQQGDHGPTACSNNNAGDNTDGCEFADGFCFPKGFRTVTLNGKNIQAFAASNECATDRFQNGDLDFDGLDYHASAWPDGSGNHPTPFSFVGPFDSGGNLYPQVQFETDMPASEALCNQHGDGRGCTVPAISDYFYPYWLLDHASVTGSGNSCAWDLGKNWSGTISNFNREAQYGGAEAGRGYYGNFIGQAMANPMKSAPCA
jgi:hypothetical protein